MSSEQFSATFQRTTPPSPEGALPVVTFADAVTFHWNGEEIRVYHVPPAHTDGDAIVHFVKADVVHMGDTFFNGSYPFIDVSSGGRVDGVIAAADRVLAGTTRQDPHHPRPRAARDEGRPARATATRCKTLRDRIAKLKAEGKARDAVIAAKPTADYDAKWGQGFMKPDVFIGHRLRLAAVGTYAYFPGRWSDQRYWVRLRIASSGVRASVPSVFLKASPQAGMSGVPCPRRASPLWMMRRTRSSGKLPPLRAASVVMSGTGTRRSAASGPSPRAPLPWQETQ